MRLRRWVLLGLLAGLVLLLGWLQYRLWLGIGSAGEVAALESQVAHQQREQYQEQHAQGLQRGGSAQPASETKAPRPA